MKFIIVSEIEISFLKQRHHYIAEEFSKYGDVIFIERVASRSFTIKNVSKYLYGFIRNFKFFNRSAIVNKGNITTLKSFYIPSNSVLALLYNKFLFKFLYQHHFKDSFVYTFTPTFNFHGSKYVCFDIIHNWWDMPWNKKYIEIKLSNLLKNSDLVICDTKPIFDKLDNKINKKLMLPGLSNKWLDGCRNTQIKNNFDKKLKNIVFFGNLRSNSDLQLIKDLSQNYHIDIYGLIQEDCKFILNNNCVYKGKLSQEDLVIKLQDYDCVLLPYKNDDFSRFISPAKYFECIALKVPIISNSNLSALPLWDKLTIKAEKGIVCIDNYLSVKEFIKLNEKLVDEIIEDNIWEKKVEKLIRNIFIDLKIIS